MKLLTYSLSECSDLGCSNGGELHLACLLETELSCEQRNSQRKLATAVAVTLIPQYSTVHATATKHRQLPASFCVACLYYDSSYVRRRHAHGLTESCRSCVSMHAIRSPVIPFSSRLAARRLPGLDTIEVGIEPNTNKNELPGCKLTNRTGEYHDGYCS